MDFLQRFLVYPLEDLAFVVAALVIAFTIHEFSHAYAAYKFGDSTAKDQGRVTLDPRSHLDVIGTILIFIAGFGWAKPVPVVRSHFKYPRLMGIAVTAAGPVSNLALAFIGIVIHQILLVFGWDPEGSIGSRAIENFYFIFVDLNIILFIFNLIPLPPLDGYRIIEDLASNNLRARMKQYEQWGIIVFFLMILIPPLRSLTIEPLFNLKFDIFLLFKSIISVFVGG